MEKIKGVEIIHTDLLKDDRGFFLEAYKDSEQFQMKQSNISYSMFGVLRGLHFQKDQAKLVRCVAGHVWDVWVDLRKDSPTLGKWGFTNLDTIEKSVLIPAGLAHGFFVLSREGAIVNYGTNSNYDPKLEGGISWSDQKVNIQWPFENSFTPVLSLKDRNLRSMDEYLESLG